MKHLKTLLLTIALLTSVVLGTINTETNDAGPYTGDGVTVAYTFSFPLVNKDTSTLVVTKENTTTNARTTLVLNTDYTVSATNNNYSTGGTVTLTTAPTSSEEVLIYRKPTITQENNLNAQSSFRNVSTTTMENTLDDAVTQTSFQNWRFEYLFGDSNGISLYSPAERASTYWGSDANGKLTPYTSLSSGSGALTSWWNTRVSVDPNTWFKSFIYDANEAEARGTIDAAKDHWYNVTEAPYNATSDGSVDVSDEIQSAIDDANDAGGGVVYLPAGTYLFNTSSGSPLRVLDVYDNITIVGDGYSTVLDVDDGADVPHLFRADGADNCIFANFSVDGSGTTGGTAAIGAINFRSALGGRVENVWIENWKGTGIMMDMVDQTTVENCYIYRPYEHGVYISGTRSGTTEGGNIVRSCTIEESGYGSGTTHVSVKIANTVKKALVTNNIILDSTHLSILVELSSEDIVVSDNIIKASTQYGVQISSNCGDNVQIIDNIFLDTAQECIRIAGGDDHKISGNTFRPATGKWGIIVQQTDYSSITDNYFDGASGTVYGVDVATVGASTYNIVSNNTFNSGYSIHVRTQSDAADTYVSNNIIPGTPANSFGGTDDHTFYIDTVGVQADNLRTAIVDINNAEIKDLANTDIDLAVTAGAGTLLEVVSCVFLLDYGSEALAEPSAPDDLAIEYYSGGSQIWSDDTTGFITATADAMMIIDPNSGGAGASPIAAADNVGKSVILKNTGGNYTGNASNDTEMRVITTYRIHKSLGL